MMDWTGANRLYWALLGCTAVIWLTRNLNFDDNRQIRGGIKTVFFYFRSKKGGGGLDQSKKSLSEKTEVVKKGGGGVSGLSFFY